MSVIRAFPVLLLCMLLAGCGKRVAINAPGHPTDPAGVTAACDRLLARVVDGAGRIDFLSLSEDERELDLALAGIGAVPLPAEDPERLAYLLNAYHLLAMKAVLVQGLPEDLTYYTDRVVLYGATTFTVAGEWLTLRRVVDDLIRPERDLRIHAALNRMVKSCPRLRPEAFTGGELERQLEVAMREFATDRRHVRYDAASATLVLSPLIARSRSDFGDDEAVVALFERYGLACGPVKRIRYADWDWGVIYQGPID